MLRLPKRTEAAGYGNQLTGSRSDSALVQQECVGTEHNAALVHDRIEPLEDLDYTGSQQPVYGPARCTDPSVGSTGVAPH